MVPKIITALISAAVLSAVLGAMPCEAKGVRHRDQIKAATPTSLKPSGAPDLNRPAMDFSGAKPMLDNPHRDLIRPEQDKNQFFDQTLR